MENLNLTELKEAELREVEGGIAPILFIALMLMALPAY